MNSNLWVFSHSKVFRDYCYRSASFLSYWFWDCAILC